MVDVTETVEVDVEPIDPYAGSDDVRAFKPKRDQQKERDPKFEKKDEVWLVRESGILRQAHVMKVCSVKKLQELFKGRTYISFEYQLEDSSGLLYEKGMWVPEAKLEFCG